MSYSASLPIRCSRAVAIVICCLRLCLILPIATRAFAAAADADSVSRESADGYVLHQHVNDYIVTGDDGYAVRRSLDSLGPVALDGKRYDGYTRWNVHWEYATSSDASGSCMLVSSSVALDVEITLPQWQHSADVPDALQRRWSIYLDALRKHENGHVQNGEQEATAIVDLMRSIGLQSDCDLLDQKLQDLGQRILQHYKDNDIEYDQLTEHGRTQGAVFP